MDLKFKDLFSRALTRSYSKLKSYILAGLLFFGLNLLAILVLGLVIFILSLIPGPALLRNSLIALGSLIFVCVFLYLIAFSTLILTKIVIADEALSIKEVWKEQKPYVKGYVLFLILYMFFSIALLPLGILSLFVVTILWGFWSSFATFTYLEKHEGGLNNLWISRDTIDQKFWPIAGRMLLLTLVTVGLQILFRFAGGNVFVTIVGILFALITPVLQISFAWEIYRSLPKVETVTKPRGWFIAIAASWLLIIGFSFIFLDSIKAFFSTFGNTPNKDMLKNINQH